MICNKYIIYEFGDNTLSNSANTPNYGLISATL
jgi:hypothetical protein